MSVLSAAHFHDEEAAFAKLETIVWPNGPVCPKCGATDRIYPLNGVRTKPSKKNPVGIERFGHMAVPLDEALVTATLDTSGRGYLVYEMHPPAGLIGQWDTELVREFFGGFVENADCELSSALIFDQRLNISGARINWNPDNYEGQG